MPIGYPDRRRRLGTRTVRRGVVLIKIAGARLVYIYVQGDRLDGEKNARVVGTFLCLP